MCDSRGTLDDTSSPFWYLRSPRRALLGSATTGKGATDALAGSGGSVAVSLLTPRSIHATDDGRRGKSDPQGRCGDMGTTCERVHCAWAGVAAIAASVIRSANVGHACVYRDPWVRTKGRLATVISLEEQRPPPCRCHALGQESHTWLLCRRQVQYGWIVRTRVVVWPTP